MQIQFGQYTTTNYPSSKPIGISQVPVVEPGHDREENVLIPESTSGDSYATVSGQHLSILSLLGQASRIIGTGFEAKKERTLWNELFALGVNHENILAINAKLSDLQEEVFKALATQPNDR